MHNIGANIVLASGKVHELVAHYLSEMGIFCIGNVSVEHLQNVCELTGATLVRASDLVCSHHLGSAGQVTIVEHQGFIYTQILRSKDLSTRCISTIVLHGATMVQCEEYTRHIQDALFAVKTLIKCPKMLPGGGAFELEATSSLTHFAQEKMNTIEYMGMKAFAEACEIIPRTLAENAGLEVNETSTIQTNPQHNSFNSKLFTV